MSLSKRETPQSEEDESRDDITKIPFVRHV